MNTILQDQDSPEFQRLLKAQRVAYSKIKTPQYIVEIAAIVSAITVPICVLLFPEAKVIVGIICSAISLMAFFSSTTLKKWTLEAASIQEHFDRKLFRLPYSEVKKPIKVSRERLQELAVQYQHDDLKGWYSGYLKPQYPMSLAVLVCQKINLVWDWKLRAKYRNWIIFLSVIYCTLIFYAVVTTNKSTTEFISTIVMMVISSVALIRFIGTILTEKKSIITEKMGHSILLDQLLEDEVKNDEKLLLVASELQSAIFETRKKHHKIPDWFARCYRNKFEKEIDLLVQETIADYSRRHGVVI